MTTFLGILSIILVCGLMLLFVLMLRAQSLPHIKVVNRDQSLPHNRRRWSGKTNWRQLRVCRGWCILVVWPTRWSGQKGPPVKMPLPTLPQSEGGEG